jgi:hypothetical protein
VALSVAALVVVLIGYTRRPLPDEGTLAHLFQLAVVGLVPVGTVFLMTADWSRPHRVWRALRVPTAAVVLAFGALYYLDHYFYPPHYRTPSATERPR